MRLRGWLSTIAQATAGQVVFRLPEAAWPMRPETWKVTMKGTDRVMTLDMDGVAKLSVDMKADNWMPLAGFAFNARSAGNMSGVRLGYDAGGGGAGAVGRLERVSEPVRAPEPEPVRASEPEPVRAPEPEPVRAPEPEPVRAPEPELEPEPVRTPEPSENEDGEAERFMGDRQEL